MSLSIQKMVSDGTLSTIVLGVQYLQRNDVYVRIAGVETPQSGAPSGYTWSFLDNNTIRVLPGVPAGVEVVVYRRTDLDVMYNIYSQNAQFDESTIDENNQQLLYIAQEYFEQGVPAQLIDSVEYVHEDTTNMYYRLKLSDGKYTAEFPIPKGGAAGFEALRRTYADAGLLLVDGSFETGGTLSSVTDVLLHNVTAKAYAWSGVFPHVVIPGTDPTLPSSGYVPRTNALLRNELESDSGSKLIGFKLNAVSSVSRKQDDVNSDRVSVMDFITNATDGVADNTPGFIAAVLHCELTGRALYIPAGRKYRVTSTLEMSQYIQIVGESAGLQDIYFGLSPAGSHIKYDGTGPFIYVKPSAPNPVYRRAYGCKIKGLVLEGTSAASHGIKVSDSSYISNNDMGLSGISIEDCFIYNFKHGRAVQITWCFGNNIKNLEVENCGVALGLHYAHRTTITAGTLEQSLIGLDAVSTYDVSLFGTGLQGINSSRISTMGLAVPSDLKLWIGWDGSGFNGITRTTAQDYAGSGLRNIGSIVSWFGGYEEGNEVGYVNELGAHTTLVGKYTDLDTPVKYLAQLGAGTFTSTGHTYAQGNFPALISVYHQERNGSVHQLNIESQVIPATLPISKVQTGYKTASGTVDIFNPSIYHGERVIYDTDVKLVRGASYADGFKATGGFNKIYQELLSPATTGTKDLGAGSTGTNLLMLANAATVNFTFASGGDRLSPGVPLTLHVVNAGGSNSVLSFNDTYFRPSAASYTLPANTQSVFTFIFSNGYFIATNNPPAITL